MQNVRLEYHINDTVSVSQLTKFGFKLRSDYTYALDKYLYGKTIKVKFIANMSERVITWKVYDSTNQQQYYAFYNNVNCNNNKVAIKSIEEFNRIIDGLVENKIIEEDE